jgi:hypothetical protein
VRTSVPTRRTSLPSFVTRPLVPVFSTLICLPTPPPPPPPPHTPPPPPPPKTPQLPNLPKEGERGRTGTGTPGTKCFYRRPVAATSRRTCPTVRPRTCPTVQPQGREAGVLCQGRAARCGDACRCCSACIVQVVMRFQTHCRGGGIPGRTVTVGISMGWGAIGCGDAHLARIGNGSSVRRARW